jgi:hypothetical protein
MMKYLQQRQKHSRTAIIAFLPVACLAALLLHTFAFIKQLPRLRSLRFQEELPSVLTLPVVSSSLSKPHYDSSSSSDHIDIGGGDGGDVLDAGTAGYDATVKELDPAIIEQQSGTKMLTMEEYNTILHVTTATKEQEYNTLTSEAATTKADLDLATTSLKTIPPEPDVPALQVNSEKDTLSMQVVALMAERDALQKQAVSKNDNNNNNTSLFGSALHTSSSQPTNTSLWYWIGIVRDAAEVKPAIWDYMVKLNCLEVPQPIMVHMLVGANKEYGMKERDKRLQNQRGCAPFLIEDEHDALILHANKNGADGVPVVVPTDNRIERIARIRDVQRDRVQSLWKEHRGDSVIGGENNDIVMVADLDLISFPPVYKLISQINNMNGQDAVCVSGSWQTNSEGKKNRGTTIPLLWFF